MNDTGSADWNNLMACACATDAANYASAETFYDEALRIDPKQRAQYWRTLSRDGQPGQGRAASGDAGQSVHAAVRGIHRSEKAVANHKGDGK